MCPLVRAATGNYRRAMLSNRLAGKVAIVTGIASGIGRGSALMMARHGARVIGCDINAAGAEATVKTAADQGLDLRSLHPVDLTRPADFARVMDFAVAAHGGIDILVNAAAIVEMAWIEEMDYETQWRKTMVGELDIVFLGCQAVWPHLKARGGGSIVNFASANAHVALKMLPALAHTATKGGVLAMTRQLAMEGAPHNIRANTISPGLIVTGETERALKEHPDLAAAVRDKLMLSRLGKPEDIAYAVVYLTSNEAEWVTGADFSIDGGATAW